MKWKTVFEKNYHQLLFVAASFALMVAVSILSVHSITRDKLISASEEAMRTVEATIKRDLSEPESLFVTAAFTVRDMLVNQGADEEDVREYITHLCDYLAESGNLQGVYDGVYGLINGVFMDGTGWEPPEDYVPGERPWYMGAISRQGEVAISEPYIDAKSRTGVVSISQQLFDGEGRPLGVLAIDVSMDLLTEYVSTLQRDYGGYGLLTDGDFRIIAHPNSDYLNLMLPSINEDFFAVTTRLKAGQSVSGTVIRSSSGTRMILFLAEIYNGWYVGMLTPAWQYYREMYLVEALIISLGAALIISLSVILMRLAKAKMQSDEENRSKTTFLARMSHEIRTPMNAILGMVEIILRSELPKNVRDSAHSIKQAGVSLLSIINDILDFSKIESGRMEITPIDYKLSGLLGDIISIANARLGTKPVSFVVSAEGTLPETLTGDAVRLRQVILNLVSNAIKYTRAGSVSLNVSGTVIGSDTVLLVFAVTDTGIGIKPSDIAKLFVDFSQVDTQRNTGIEGSGLGLAIANNLCMLMGGEITVSSKYGEGSTFSVHIPQKISGTDLLAVVDEEEKYDVLLLETREAHAKSAAAAFRRMGIRYSAVSETAALPAALHTGGYTHLFLSAGLYEQARGAIAEYAPDIAVYVLAMPGEDTPPGVETLFLPVYSVTLANALRGVGQTDMPEASPRGAQITFPEARILVVDDVQTNLTVAGGLMEPYRAGISFCLSGREAIDLVRDFDFDIIFMDHMMPGMNGIEAVKAIRGMGGARFKSVPIVALTANAVSGMREMFLENGFNDYLAKPIDIDMLDQVLRRWIPREKQREEHETHEPHEPELSAVIEPLPQPVAVTSAKEPGEIAVAGLDIERGIKMIGGSERSYRKVLNLFAKDARARLASFLMPPDEATLVDFALNVHALKSSLGSIGATEVYERAIEIETSARRGELADVQRQFGGFISSLTALVEALEKTL